MRRAFAAAPGGTATTGMARATAGVARATTAVKAPDAAKPAESAATGVSLNLGRPAGGGNGKDVEIQRF